MLNGVIDVVHHSVLLQALDVDPATGELEGDEEGFPEEYPLETLTISTADFMAKVWY